MIPAALLEKAGRRLITIAQSARLVTAAQAFDQPETRLMVVLDMAGAMVGVVSRTDIVARISHCTGCSCTEPVAAAMTTDVKCCAPSDAVEGIWKWMKQTGFTHMPVLDSARRPLGVLAARDVLETLLEDREHEESLLADYVSGIGYR